MPLELAFEADNAARGIFWGIKRRAVGALFPPGGTLPTPGKRVLGLARATGGPGPVNLDGTKPRVITA